VGCNDQQAFSARRPDIKHSASLTVHSITPLLDTVSLGSSFGDDQSHRWRLATFQAMNRRMRE
jgi:hypothetical protein